MVVTRTDRPAGHRDRLLSAGNRQFYEHGYNGAAVDSILQSAGSPKGSFYHHFGSKESFGLAVIQRYLDQQKDLLSTWVAAEHLTVPDRLAGYHTELTERFVATRYQSGCLIGKLSNEVSNTSETIRDRISDGFLEWQERLADLLAEGQARGEVTTELSAGTMGQIILAMLQGGFSTAMSLRDEANLKAVTAGIVDLISVPAT